MKNIFILVLAIVLMSSFVGCGKAISPTAPVAPVATTATVSLSTATATETSTVDPLLPTNTATETAVVSEETATETATFNPTTNLLIVTTNTIDVVVRLRHVDEMGVETISDGVLMPSNNPAYLVQVNHGDVVEVMSKDQTSLEVITLNATWGGAAFIRVSDPHGTSNSVELPPRS